MLCCMHTFFFLTNLNHVHYLIYVLFTVIPSSLTLVCSSLDIMISTSFLLYHVGNKNKYYFDFPSDIYHVFFLH